MEPAQLLLFNATLLAAMATPGPALVFAIKQAATGGFRAGLMTGCGLAVVAAGWTAAALWGLDMVFRLFPAVFIVLKTAGALYLLWLAWRMWQTAREPLDDHAPSGTRAFWSGVLVNLGNPKSVLFAASVLVVIFPAGLGMGDKVFIIFNHFVVELFVYALLAATLASPPARATYLGMKPVLDRITAIILGGLGLRLLLGRS
ncbi:MAG: LysE family translocator [Pseudomonadota bacterium]